MKYQSQLPALLFILVTTLLVGQELMSHSADAAGLYQSPLPTPTFTATHTPTPTLTPTPYNFHGQSQMDFQVDRPVAVVGDRLTYTMALTTIYHPANFFFIQTEIPPNTVWRNNLQSTANAGVYINNFVLWYWPTNPPYPTVITTTFQVEIVSLPDNSTIDNEALFFFSEAAGSGIGIYMYTQTVQTLVVAPTSTSTPSPSPSSTSLPATAPRPTATATPILFEIPAPLSTPIQWPEFLPETGL